MSSIYLNDGTCVQLFGSEREAFANLIYEKLGPEAEKEFRLLIAQAEEDY